MRYSTAGWIYLRFLYLHIIASFCVHSESSVMCADNVTHSKVLAVGCSSSSPWPSCLLHAGSSWSGIWYELTIWPTRQTECGHSSLIGSWVQVSSPWVWGHLKPATWVGLNKPAPLPYSGSLLEHRPGSVKSGQPEAAMRWGSPREGAGVGTPGDSPGWAQPSEKPHPGLRPERSPQWRPPSPVSLPDITEQRQAVSLCPDCISDPQTGEHKFGAVYFAATGNQNSLSIICYN